MDIKTAIDKIANEWLFTGHSNVKYVADGGDDTIVVGYVASSDAEAPNVPASIDGFTVVLRRATRGFAAE